MNTLLFSFQKRVKKPFFSNRFISNLLTDETNIQSAVLVFLEYDFRDSPVFNFWLSMDYPLMIKY